MSQPRGWKGTPEERFWSKVDKTETCWLWTAAVTDGYGAFRVDGRTVRAHRWLYEQMVGPIPNGLVLDHLCRIPACVRPDHLEPVTDWENLHRGVGPTARNAAKTHCPQGHEYSPENTIHRRGGRECRECVKIGNRERSRTFQRRLREKRGAA